MASATRKAASLTTLKIGNVEVPVGLFGTVAAPSKLAEFETAGPHGGKLKAEYRARPVPVIEASDAGEDVPVHSSDPLADEEFERTEMETGDGRPLYREEGTGHLYARDPGPDEPVPTPERAAGLVESMVEPTGPVDPLGPGPGQESDSWDRGPGPEMPTTTRAEAEAATITSAVDGEYGRVLVEEGSGEVVEPQNVRRGIRLSGGRFVDCTARLAKIEEDTKLDRMDVIGFVDSTQVPRTRVKGAQYIGAGDEKAPRALRIMYEALKGTRRMALVKLTKRSRQTLGVIGVARGVLVLIELVWAEDFREAPARAKVIQKETVSEREVAMFVELVQAMPVPMSELDSLRDDAIAERELLRTQAEAGELPAELVDAEVVDPVDDLMAQLEASLAAAGSS